MTKKRKAVLATGNPHKFSEISAVLGGDYDLVNQTSLSVESAEETGLTFVENALIKGRHVANATDLPVIADDSGLVVPALGGEPGIYSARYAGANASAQANCKKLLQQMAHCEDRRAYYYCSIVWLESPTDPTPLIAEARWHGQILHQESGESGFGYDPVFQPDGMAVSVAILGQDEKNRISHRALALASLRDQLLA